ncbi:ATP-binding protein [Neobacillus massiliamazoniensis]|uniref:histidine kinase n=1 Tax=Neobacillus massiliamazoniensis TaxID=1499688 RepID=A0A0U1NX42_9BACI|nr:ATP-binding protein [Neobacillus massiliamazoniensis]CRK82342.1 integral membrane sensor signal transduction histidine kinase [Neobacillus massiliamazoniensis]
MHIDVKVVLYQVLIILFPIFVYHLFFYEKNSNRKKPLSKLTFIMIIILVLSMSYPIEFSKGYRYDFRVIPFIISFVYGGTWPGFIIWIVLLTYRFIIGGGGFYVALVNYSFTFLVLIFIGKKFELNQLKHKLVFVNLVFLANTLIMMLTLLKANQMEQIRFMLVFHVVTWICLMMVVFVIENANQQMEIREKIRRDEKLNVISQLAASVAHEVRNPMTSARGFLQLIYNDENLKSMQKYYIEIALNELDHAQSIINDYLSLAKPNTEEMTEINISDEVKKTIDLMTSYSYIQNITIEANIQESLFIRGNRNEIKQILVNIIKNGIEAMNKGGTLTVYTYKLDGRILIEIIDSGKGMTKSQLKKLGTLFYTTKEKGTGVGLTISFQLVQAMNGKIRVNSEPGKGTTFTIEFPVVSIDSLPL